MLRKLFLAGLVSSALGYLLYRFIAAGEEGHLKWLGGT